MGLTVEQRRRRDEDQFWEPWFNKLTSFACDQSLAIERRNTLHPEYQLALLTGDGVRLIAYPHRTKSTGNRSCRIRDENSHDKKKAAALMVASGLYVKQRFGS